jgi:hypothetical protein
MHGVLYRIHHHSGRYGSQNTVRRASVDENGLSENGSSVEGGQKHLPMKCRNVSAGGGYQA